MRTVKLRKQKGEGRRRIGYLEEGALFQAALAGKKNADTVRAKRTRCFNIDGFCRRQSRYLRSLKIRNHIFMLFATFPETFYAARAGNARCLYTFMPKRSVDPFEPCLLKEGKKGESFVSPV